MNIGPYYQKCDTRAAAAEVAREIAPRGCRGKIADELYAAYHRRQQRQSRPAPVGVRTWLRRSIEARWADWLEEQLPGKSGAGKLVVRARIDTQRQTPDCRAERKYGDSRSVARSYGYPVWDHYVTWIIPVGWRVSLVDGVPVCERCRGGEYSRYRAERARGFRGKWVRAK